jgi:hypothetical protein
MDGLPPVEVTARGNPHTVRAFMTAHAHGRLRMTPVLLAQTRAAVGSAS